MGGWVTGFRSAFGSLCRGQRGRSRSCSGFYPHLGSLTCPDDITDRPSSRNCFRRTKKKNIAPARDATEGASPEVRVAPTQEVPNYSGSYSQWYIYMFKCTHLYIYPCSLMQIYTFVLFPISGFRFAPSVDLHISTPSVQGLETSKTKITSVMLLLITFHM